MSWKKATISQKLGAVGLVGNVGLIAGIFYRKYEHDLEENRARLQWLKLQDDDDLNCFFTAQRYYEQCKFELDDSEIQDCKNLSSKLSDCKRAVGQLIPEITPAMRELPAAFRPPVAQQ